MDVRGKCEPWTIYSTTGLEPALISCLVCLSVYLSSVVSMMMIVWRKMAAKTSSCAKCFDAASALFMSLLSWIRRQPATVAAFEASAFMTFPCKLCPTMQEVRKGRTWWMFPPAPGLIASSQTKAEWSLQHRTSGVNKCPWALLLWTTLIIQFIIDCSYCVYYLYLISSEENCRAELSIWLQNTFLYLLHHIILWHGYKVYNVVVRWCNSCPGPSRCQSRCQLSDSQHLPVLDERLSMVSRHWVAWRVETQQYRGI